MGFYCASDYEWQAACMRGDGRKQLMLLLNRNHVSMDSQAVLHSPSLTAADGNICMENNWVCGQRSMIPGT